MFPWKFPKEGSLVLTEVSEINEYGVYVKLLEYDNKIGMIASGQLSTRRLKHIRQCTHENKREICRVLAVDEERGNVDLSRKMVESSDREEFMERHGERIYIYNSAHGYCTSAGIDFNTFYQNTIWELYQKWSIDEVYEKLYEEKIKEEFTENKHFADFILAKFVRPERQIRALISISCLGSEGVDAIRDVMIGGTCEGVKVQHVCSPVYSVSTFNTSIEKGAELIYTSIKKMFEVAKSKKRIGIRIYQKAKVIGDTEDNIEIDDDEIEKEYFEDTSDKNIKFVYLNVAQQLEQLLL